jgi:hypothetical protein
MNGIFRTLYPSPQNSWALAAAEELFIAVSSYALMPATDSAATIPDFVAFTGVRLTSQ